jgi:hypothetical protein
MGQGVGGELIQQIVLKTQVQKGLSQIGGELQSLPFSFFNSNVSTLILLLK